MAARKITVIDTLVRALTAIEKLMENDSVSNEAKIGLAKVCANETLDEGAEDVARFKSPTQNKAATPDKFTLDSFSPSEFPRARLVPPTGEGITIGTNKPARLRQSLR